ncbi:hypothetical protein BCR36DRAFT_165069, partial [Piromyces finnis]
FLYISIVLNDLYNECYLLEEIRIEYRTETEEVYNKKTTESKDFNRLIHGSSFQIAIFKDKIKFLINNLKEIQQNNLKKNTIPESTYNIVNYIIKENELQEQETYIEKLKDKISPASTFEKKSDSIQKINFLSIDPIVNELRHHLLKEKNYLLKKIDLYHDLLDNEKSYRTKIKDFTNQELPTLKAFQEASKELFDNIQKEKEEYNFNLIFNNKNFKKTKEEIITVEKEEISEIKSIPNYKNQYHESSLYDKINMNQLSLKSNDDNGDNRKDEKEKSSIIKVYYHHRKNSKEKRTSKQNTKLKKKKYNSLPSSESMPRNKSINNMTDNNESKSISRSPSTPTLHRSPSKEYLPIASNTQIPLTLPLTSLVPSINLPFSSTPINKKIILNPIIPHPPIKPIKNDKIFSRKRYCAVPSSASIVTSSKLA